MIFFFSDRFDGVALTCGVEDGAVVRLEFERTEATPNPPEGAARLWERVKRELSEYFAGERRAFDLPLRYSGTEFQRLVWRELSEIPYGETRSYGELAARVGRPKAARAVGMACHVNHICILIPCHRVVSASGSLTGFAGGIDVKEKLLTLEGVRVKSLRKNCQEEQK